MENALKHADSDLSDVLRRIDDATAPRRNIPFDQTQQFHDVLSGAHEFLLNRIEEQHLDITSWSQDTITKYAEIETANFV
ncbi:hypothetical protein GCM10011408_24110 [Dyella caseinilytica]|nr:hypothetical protein GCM10011408_24110 [Dyella caseinilytica]